MTWKKKSEKSPAPIRENPPNTCHHVWLLTDSINTIWQNHARCSPLSTFALPQTLAKHPHYEVIFFYRQVNIKTSHLHLKFMILQNVSAYDFSMSRWSNQLVKHLPLQTVTAHTLTPYMIWIKDSLIVKAFQNSPLPPFEEYNHVANWRFHLMM